MTLEINKPELEVLIEELKESGANVDEVLFATLSARKSAIEQPVKYLGKKNLAQFLLDSPLPGSGLRVERQKDTPRPVEL